MKTLRKSLSILLSLLLVLGTIAVGGMTASADTVYTVTLDPGEGSGEPIVYRSSDQTEFPGWHDAQDFQFYLEDNGEMGFRFNKNYVPDSFTAPAGYGFDGWQGATFYNTFPSGVTDIVFTAKWRKGPASYSLSPSEYTIENSGYTDILCSFDSLFLGNVTYGNRTYQANRINFCMNAGTLTGGNGSSIPFLVDEEFHFGAADRKDISNSYHSQEAIFIMSVWIDPEDYAAAAPGTYTGELVYDSEWNTDVPNVAGESGSITLTLVIPDPFESMETYTDWEGTLVIDESKSVRISGATHDNNGTTYGSAIKICNNSTVDLYFDGANVLSANPDVISAGIEVEEGSTVNIYGFDGSSLTVTGGYLGAGIGGIGYGSVSALNPKAGNINIYSGTIVATGGDKGAGIGSGYHSSAGDINIYGGDITAIGKGFGAGIGSGYGTSGGTPVAAGVGFYNGGNITISGGTVRATSSADENFSFDSFDIFDSETYPREDSFAAGIGGGYGASSGNIIIEGNAVVTAIGSCGGTGIGTGRGTTKEAYYDADNYVCNIIIRGNAKVIALATADLRETIVGDDGGAAIGLGRHCAIVGQPVGTIFISENAEVTALAECWANAIGSGCAVGKFTKDSEGNIKRPVRALMESVEIAGTAVVHAYSDGNRASVFEVTYTDWEGTLVIDESKSVAISGVTHDNNGTGYASAIKICNNSTVDLYIEGANVLSGNPDVISAGIELEEGSTVNIYGFDGSTLTVTGGKYSAGIGGIGYGSISAFNPKAGNINIYSGTIVATGGDKGAGIGSGYHSSAGDINIYGGDITAIGTACGAGIGSGYGTSGGTPVAAGVGFYNGGNITISGGTVRATASDDGNFSFDSFDIFNSETYPRGNTFAAGIGGGYGASAGNIVIEGDADVTAIGCCGGAGIGTGRGTTKESNYDSENFDCNITIRGNAKVIALATADLRETIIGDDGGAAIGLGRHCAIVGRPVGTISISENAEVTALAECWANAIGSGCALGKFTKDADGNIIRPEMAQMESVDIDDIAAVHAYSDGNRGPYYEEFPYIMIAFLDTDDNILQIGKYGWHAVPELNFEAPSKPMTDQYTYPLTGWDDGNGNVCPADAITPAEADVTYTPVFTETSRFTPTISATEVVRGDKLTWNVSGPLNVTWLRFNGTDEN
ncbi:MAG: hypothetical protein IK097_02940, partial [Clostridia bacterium]|nr:hypothetical protein [Clostridia bacterium]